jgi:hypothetical protein
MMMNGKVLIGEFIAINLNYHIMVIIDIYLNK